MGLPSNLLKDALVLILFFLSAYLPGDEYFLALCDPCGCPNTLGYPLHFAQNMRVGASFERGNFSCGTETTEFYFQNLILDLIFWFLLVHLADYAIKRYTGKKK